MTGGAAPRVYLTDTTMECLFTAQAALGTDRDNTINFAVQVLAMIAQAEPGRKITVVLEDGWSRELHLH